MMMIFSMIVGIYSFGLEELAYLLQQAPGQISLLQNRVPIEKVLRREDLDPAIRSKLELVLDVRKFSSEKIGLAKNKSYTVYREVDRQALAYNLTACPRYGLSPVTWKFPIVGSVPYLGFFKKGDALKRQAEFERHGYDVYVRVVNAYSMLGIVPDPIYTPMLKWRDYDLANTVIHELAHATVWTKNYPEFNENFALFIGNQGALNYCREKFGPNSEEVRYGTDFHHDALLFQEYLLRLKQDLDALYRRSDLTAEDKLSDREKIFAETIIDFEENWLPRMKTDDYHYWTRLELNNATVVSHLVYYHDLTLYEKVYEKSGANLANTVAIVKDLIERNKGDPEKLLHAWVEQTPSP